MVSSKTFLRDLNFYFNNELTDEPVFEFPLFMYPEALPQEPPTDWSMKTNGWPHLRWTDPVAPPSLEDLEGIHFTPLDVEGSSDTMKRLLSTRLTSETFKQMLDGRAPFVLEDYCHIPKEKEYWCRIGEEGMMAHEYIISESNVENIYILVCIYHFAFGLRFPLHPFFSQILCHFHLSLNQLLPQATRKIMSFIWTCEYMKLPLTLNLFKSLLKLDENKINPLLQFLQ